MASTHDDRPWWKRWPSELTSIVFDLRAQGWTVSSVIKDEGLHSVTIEVTGLPDPPGNLEMRFGPATPAVGPTVFGPLGLPEHQHPIERNLCLPHDATDTIAAIHAAIKLYQQPEETAARAAEPWSEHMRRSREEGLLLPLVLPDGEWGSFTARVLTTATTSWGWVDSVTVGPYSNPSEVVVAEPKLRRALAQSAPGLPLLRGVWFRTTEVRYPLDEAGLLEFWRSGAPAAARHASETMSRSPGQRVPDSGPRRPPAMSMNGLIVPEEGPEKGVWKKRLIVIAERQGIPSTVVTEPLTLSATRLPGLEPLPNKSVAVAGIGMIGAAVAIHLAQSGLGGLRLLDHDRVEVGNLVRQQYDLRDVGRYKTGAIRRQVLRKAPWCEVDQEHLLSLRAQWYRPDQLHAWLDGCDVLVAATADLQAEIYLSRLAKKLDIPVVGGWVGADIWGGFIYRTRWGESGCRSCIDQHYKDVVSIPEPEGSSNVFTAGCGHPTFPGSVVDGNTVSDAIARLALNLLSPIYPDAPGDVASIRLRDASEAGGVAFDWRRFPPSAECVLCR